MFGRKQSIVPDERRDDKAGLRAFILELRPFDPHSITPESQHEEYLASTLMRQADKFEVEHIFCRVLWDNPRLVKEIEAAGIRLMRAGNMVPLFTDEWLVRMINTEPAPHRFRNALRQAGWGTMHYDRGQSGSKLEEKSRFLIGQMLRIASSPASGNAKELAVLNLHEWTFRLLQGKILMGNLN